MAAEAVFFGPNYTEVCEGPKTRLICGEQIKERALALSSFKVIMLSVAANGTCKPLSGMIYCLCYTNRISMSPFWVRFYYGRNAFSIQHPGLGHEVKVCVSTNGVMRFLCVASFGVAHFLFPKLCVVKSR